MGIIAIYAGAPMNAALIMGATLEMSKLVTISWLYRNWDTSTWVIKAPLIYFTIALIIATSIGVFGFLTKSHIQQGAATVNNVAKVTRLDQQIAREKSLVDDNEKVIAQLDSAVNSYIGKDNADKSISVRRSQANQRKQLRSDIDIAQKKIDEYNDEKLALESEVRGVQLDVGPIKYIAGLFYDDSVDDAKKIETAVKLFTLLIVSTLDPLAIVLLIAANQSLMRYKPGKIVASDEIREPVPVPAPAPVVPAVLVSEPVIEQIAETMDEPPLDIVVAELPPAINDVIEIDVEKNPDEQPVVDESYEDVILDNNEEENEPWHEPIPEPIAEAAPLDSHETPKDGAQIQDKKPVLTVHPHVQSDVVRGILGNAQHFIPQKLLEPEVVQKMPPTTKVDDKYPRALSWLKEFKRA